MSKQNLNYEDGIPEEILWNPETNSFMKRSLFPGKWIPARISVWDADNSKYQYRPGRDRTYQEAMKSISGNSTPGDRSERPAQSLDQRNSRGKGRRGGVHEALRRSLDGDSHTVRQREYERTDPADPGTRLSV